MTKTILIVDDSPTELRIVRDALASGSYSILTAVDGEEALRIAAESKLDLILLDVILPKKNGFQVCRQLKTSPETQGIPIILVTSKSLDSDRFWGLKQGADDYLTKPFEADELLQRIGKLI